MILKMLLEIILAILTYFSALSFWQITMRWRFTKLLLRDKSGLNRIVSLMKQKEQFDLPSKEISVTGHLYTDNYQMNITLEMSSSGSSLMQVRKYALLAVAAILVISYFLGIWYLVINGVIFFLAGLVQMLPAATANATQDIVALAWNINKFSEQDATKCANFINETMTVLIPLYEIVTA